LAVVDLDLFLTYADLSTAGNKAQKVARLRVALRTGDVGLAELLSSLTKPRLVRALEQLGLDGAGTKAELVRRAARSAARTPERTEADSIPDWKPGAWYVPDWGNAFFSRGMGGAPSRPRDRDRTRTDAGRAPSSRTRARRSRPTPPPASPPPPAPKKPREPRYPEHADENERFFLFRADVSWPLDVLQLREVRRRLAKELHPDRNPGRTAAHFEFIAMNRGYETLLQRLTRA
jgi:hypothetical protein